MSSKSTDMRRSHSAGYDPMGDTWLALIAHAGAVMRRFDSGVRLFDFRRNRRDIPEE